MTNERKQRILSFLTDDIGSYYYDGPLDGVWGPASQAAADRFLRDFTGETVTDTNVGKWIPVSERLPKNFISVLVHIPDMKPCPTVIEAYRFDDGWVTKMAAFDINCATHWMPLPEPPKEEKQ